MSNWKINHSDLQIKTKCFICNNDNNEILSNVKYKNFQILETTICNDCGLVWRSKVPKFSWFVTAWNARNKSGESNNTLGISKKTEVRRKIRYRAIANNLKKATKGMTHLDIGTGPGRGLKEFINLGFDSTGLEPDISRAEVGQREGLPVLNLTLEEFIEKNQDKRFDVVTVVQALEHMQNPQDFINKCKKVLKHDGVLYIEVPNANNFIRWQDSLYMEHLYNFSFNHLAHMGGR